MADTEQKISIIHNDISISHCIRRITKMTSNVETGTDQAAFDVAIEKEIAQLSETTRARGQFWVVISNGGPPVELVIPGRCQKSTGGSG
jgi:hypothetical protein